MRALVAILILALMTGCDRTRVINAGAAIEIRLHTREEIAREFTEFRQLGAVSDFRWNRTIVTLPREVSDDELIRLTLHEFVRHVLPRMAPETEPACKRLLELLTTDHFQPLKCAPRDTP